MRPKNSSAAPKQRETVTIPKGGRPKNSSAAPKQRETVTIPKGGRPKNEARDVAVLLARWWRINVIGEQVKQADGWIAQHWTSRKAKGLTEDAAVRRSIRKAKYAMKSDRYMILRTEGLPLVFAVKNPASEGSQVWSWYEGLLDAQLVEVEGLQVKPDEGTPFFNISFKLPIHNGGAVPDWFQPGELKGDAVYSPLDTNGFCPRT